MRRKQRRNSSLLAILLLLVIALYMNRDGLFADEPGTEPATGEVRAWPPPTEAQLEKLKAEKGMKLSASALKKLKTATVVRVVDGDTVELTIGSKKEKVRLLNVNTPETVDPRKPVEEYGKEASAFTKSILPPGTKVFYKTDVEERDRYDRLLVHIYLEDGTWFNALLIRAGYAQLMTISPNVSAADFFKDLQAKARREEIGLWQIPVYQNPPKQ